MCLPSCGWFIVSWFAFVVIGDSNCIFVFWFYDAELKLLSDMFVKFLSDRWKHCQMSLMQFIVVFLQCCCMQKGCCGW